MRTIEARPGDHINHAVRRLLDAAIEHGEVVGMTFNEVAVVAGPFGQIDAIVAAYSEELDRRRSKTLERDRLIAELDAAYAAIRTLKAGSKGEWSGAI